ncbi:hypothetical protein N2152v2_002773 [Parachlorella kessleri]
MPAGTEVTSQPTAANPTSTNGVELSPASKPILLFIASADHFGATPKQSAGLELNAAKHPVETAQLSAVAERSHSSAGGSRAQLPQSASGGANSEHAHQLAGADDEDILALMPDNCDPPPAPAMLPTVAAEGEARSSFHGALPDHVQQPADDACSTDSLSLGILLARLLSGTTSSSSLGGSGHSTSRKGSNSGNPVELLAVSDVGSIALPSAHGAADTGSRYATLSVAAASEGTTQLPGSDALCDSYCAPARLSLDLGLDMAWRSSLRTSLPMKRNTSSKVFSRSSSGPTKPAAGEGMQQELVGGRAAEEATREAVQVAECESVVPRAGGQLATKASGGSDEEVGRQGYHSNSIGDVVAAALMDPSGLQGVRTLGLARTGSSLKAPVSSPLYATHQSPCAPDTSVLLEAPQPSALPASERAPLASVVGGGQDSKAQPSAESTVGDAWASATKTATARRSAAGTPRTHPAYLKATLSSASRVASGYCCEAASPGFRHPASRTASSSRLVSCTVSPRLTRQPAHHEAALEEHRSQQEAKARAASPTPLPKATVVQEFRLRTSRRAECDTARVSEEALLTTEEREAREAEAARLRLLDTIRASRECASRAATPRPATAPSYKVAEPTVPQPFKLASESLHEKAQQELARLVEAKRAAEQPLQFKASVFEEKIKAGVAAHKSPKGQYSTDFKVPAMTTDARIERYHAREQQRWARADEMARSKAEKERAKQEALDREAEEYRQQHRICLSPVPDFSHVFKPDLSKKRASTAFCPFKLAHTASLS